MKLKIENGMVVRCVNVIDRLPLKGMKSIHRTRISRLLTEKLERVGKEEEAIRKEHCNLDEEGEPIVLEDNKLDIIDLEAFRKDIDEFYAEKVVIDDGDNQVAMKSLKKSLEESEEEWDGKEAYAFEHLYSGFEGESKKEDIEDGGE